jgi:predicted negative regulator of RcsB-dependent stress response
MTTGVRSGIGFVELLEQMVGCLLVKTSRTQEAMKTYEEALQATTASVRASLGWMESKVDNQEKLKSKRRSIKKRYRP